MLSGQPPFAGKSLEATLFAHMTQPPPPLNIQSKKLERVLDRALAKLPEDRFASAEAFERALADERVGIRVPRKIRRLVVSASAAITIFFFSSRRRHTRWNCDWSSDVCSSD